MKGPPSERSKRKQLGSVRVSPSRRTRREIAGRWAAIAARADAGPTCKSTRTNGAPEPHLMLPTIHMTMDSKPIAKWLSNAKLLAMRGRWPGSKPEVCDDKFLFPCFILVSLVASGCNLKKSKPPPPQALHRLLPFQAQSPARCPHHQPALRRQWPRQAPHPPRAKFQRRKTTSRRRKRQLRQSRAPPKN